MGAVNYFGSDNEILEFLSIDNNIFTHKQIEYRNGLVFMRMKKRILNALNLNKK